ncbi:hypothetical protein ATE68_21835 [Sphingopyxis sp. H038]|uniref:hypothetical protein n=1 Tax=unclassified Sphingopyxis TaxID=2614943 RepID=UPI00073155EC|nr:MULTISPECIES: hypothetical protein [unclassified Sphingopyxis]KTE01816.1 hypothetical protein ATE78_13725 [Sphingopyxis sp. H012]KTE11768.1 hypothetical protein ATE70_06860 [Sphingopyxis sp. H053]KTE16327.1 hypothetical protein ATE76_01195 [Sphingopyxis sp. H093]KTE23840.1 hypothetical protein ATE75_18800 [Sphingopyxis sp. H080]KTE31452.1 hypothetical protein ATE68_21835 [Sphingopyxis sp. H038]
MRPFTHFAALDWSGARGPRQRGIALAVASGNVAPALVRPGHIWSRSEILEWLEGVVAAGENMLIGFDFSAAFAFADHGAYFPGWAESPADMRMLWALVERLAGGDPHYEAGGFLAHAEVRRHFRQRGEAGDLFEAGAGRLRVVEHHQRATKQAASVSNFNLVGAAQVGKASLSGMRLLHRLSRRIPLWPGDPVPATGPMLVEIYTSLAARAAGLPPGRSKIRDGAALDAALAALGSPPCRLTGPVSDHASDALLTAAWLRAIAGDAAPWSPSPLTDRLARTEGWTFGII